MFACQLLFANSEPTSSAALIVQLLVLMGLVVLSGCFSGSETALFSLTRHQLEQAAASRNPFRRLVASLMKQPKQTLMKILVGNTLVNVLLFAATYTLTQGLEPTLGWWVVPLGAVFSIGVVLVLGEVVPKVVAVALAGPIAPYAATFINTTGYVLGPIGMILDLILVEPLTRILFGRPTRDDDEARPLSTEELKALLEISRRQGVLERFEDLYLREVIDLRSVRVADIMVPRTALEAFDINRGSDELRQMMRETHRTKVPAYDGDIDNVIGLLYAKVVFFEPDRPLRELVTPVRYVPESLNCEQLLEHFQVTKSQIALVVDEYGGIEGLATLEDVLEEIVGEIFTPEEAPELPEVQMISPVEYDVVGNLSVHYWAEAFDLPRLTERIVTVAGLVAARLNKAPEVGDEITVGNMRIRVAAMQGRRVERLNLRLDADDTPPEGIE